MALAQNCDKEHHHQLCVGFLKFGHIFQGMLLFAFSALKGIAKSGEVFCHSGVLSEHLLLQALDKLV